MDSPTPPRNGAANVPYPRALSLLGALISAGTMLFFGRRGYYNYFSADDIMNLYVSWQKSILQLAGDSLLFFSPAYRPLGNLVYRATFQLAGFHPRPFRVVCFCLLLVNLIVFYRAAAAILDREAATLALVFGCYNVAINVYDDMGVIYDLLCLTFFLLALSLYVDARRRTGYLTVPRLCAFLFLYIGALDSKEIAVALPAVILAWESLLAGDATAAGVSLTRRWTPFALSLLITVPYVLGKFSHASPFRDNDAYRLHFTVDAFVQGVTHYAGLLFSAHPGAMRHPVALGALAVSAALAILLRDRHMIFGLLFALLTSAPVLFVAPRSAYVMYVPWFGIALYLSTLVIRMRSAVATRLGLPSGRQSAKTATLLLCAFSVLAFHNSRGWSPPAAPPILDTIVQLRKLLPTVPQNARILFLDDPFDADDWLPISLCRLYYGYPVLAVHRVKMMPSKPDQATIDSYDIVIAYRDSKYALLKPPA